MLRGRVNEAALREWIQAAVADQVNAAANAVCESAKALAPVETGRLRNSIRVRAEGGQAYVFTDCEYAAAVEFGTSRRSARPFLTAAVWTAEGAKR